jgi:hypothetical protein
LSLSAMTTGGLSLVRGLRFERLLTRNAIIAG